ncbi:dolichol-phosphate mannosyltransferase [Kineosphaera limosa]|uniref:Putative glycosyltransferase n=1 Tax=Kineosphaera limosa NBRC 100340 TaxID=1184609 RepID=K6WY83_9MICO|nr:glycosyltransferase family 2 protein [Kineosphaera limosa]NYD99283.1 dolichol-phosphate mannosyltransferase [Kineosphaera limosa]GAB97067.1 putative glycosyltransferase [Kineosphaera limosa NBRC 100340]
MHVELSVVVPVYNEEDVLPLLVERLRPVLDGLSTPYEVVAVDDGSTDASPVLMQRIRHEWPQFRVVRLRANAGHQAAISAGLALARGDYMVTIDADLQDPPEVVEQMLQIARSERVDVVYGVRSDRSTDTAFKRGTARAFYATMRALAKTEAPMDAGDFRLMSRATVDAVNALPEHHRVLRLVVPALGFPSAKVTYRREERAAGSSKYPLSKMIRLSLDSLTSHSMAPLRLATWFGLIGGVFAMLIFAYALWSSFTDRAVAGWTSTVAAVSSVGAVQLICLGLLGEYVGRMYTMMQGRPTYFVAHDTDDLHLHDVAGSEAGEEVVGLASRPDRTPSGSFPVVPGADVAADSLTTSLEDFDEPIDRSHGHRHTENGTPAANGGRPVEAPVMNAERRQAVRRTSAKRLTPGSDFTGR